MRQIVQANQLDKIEQWHKVAAVTTGNYEAKPIRVRLKDLWWVGYRDSRGRNGHSYTAPFLMTASMWLLRVRGVDCFWDAYYPLMQDESGDRYEPANIVYQPPGRSHGVEIRCLFPDWMVRAECKVNYWLLRVKHYVRT